MEKLMTKIIRGGSKPRITLTAQDHARLSRLASAAANTLPEVASVLADELDRAHVLAAGRHPANVVCMGSEVIYRDDTTGRIQTVTLVYPNEADIAEGRASVMTPIGVALIGLSAGKSINWTTRTGALKRLTVLEVRESTLESQPSALK
jgi:regulator of nucleoside diphosphate kinase